MQLLFQRDLNPKMGRPAVEQFVRDRLRDVRSIEYSLKLFDGVTGRIDTIDERLTAAADNWRPARMAGTDRNVLRLGLAELMFNDPDTPPAVVIDEAVELARRFGSANSAAFVNGVLDRARQLLDPVAPVAE